MAVSSLNNSDAEPRKTQLLRSLLALAGSLAVALILPAANEPELFSWHSIVRNAKFQLVGIVLGAGLVWISWRIVGGSTSIRKFVAAYSYWLAAWLFIFSLLAALDEAAIRLFEPELFAQITAVATSGQDTARLRALVGTEDTYAMKVLLDSDRRLADASREPGMYWILSMALLRGAFTILWLIVSWRAFGKMLRMPVLRSAFSLAIILGLGLIATLTAIFFQMAPVMVDPNRWIGRSL